MRVLYHAPTGELGWLDDSRLDAMTERHKIVLRPSGEQGIHDLLRTLDQDQSAGGLVIGLFTGRVGRDTLQTLGGVLTRGRRAFLYWPAEEAIECVDRARLSSLWRHWAFALAYTRVFRPIGRLGNVPAQVRNVLRDIPLSRLPRWAAGRLLRGRRASAGPDARWPEPRSSVIARVRRLADDAEPIPFSAAALPRRGGRVPGLGVYLRLDYWAKLESGGSYGHTCYVAKELAATTESLLCVMASRFRLLDDLGLRQIVLDPPGATASEDEILAAAPCYIRLLKPLLEAVRPAYIYERLVLGNYAGAVLSQTLRIPYIVEYNGSEISMRRSFDGTGYTYEDEYIRAEDLAFKQATMINVISEEVKSTLVARGVPSRKILVNPNGADLDAYAPANAGERAAVRRELGFNESDVVVGFTGTFGGWHGVDVLAEAMPKICASNPLIRLLLIGDGNYKHLVDRTVEQHRLGGCVRAVGRVPQTEGARLLKACDIYVSPHNSHMVDSKFFGSPTKIFEYMAMSGGIVASDLEQIGQILSPALRVADFSRPDLRVNDERAVLCTPGSVEEFTEAVVGLASRLDVARALGRNARTAVANHYSWSCHVAHLWEFLSNGSHAQSPDPVEVATGDEYKDEVQRQWDNDPAGSHYVKDAERHTLDWFLEAEAYRYGEYAPWMRETMEFERHAGEQLLEIGGGMGTDLAQFAKHGACVTDLDLSSGHLELAKESFRLRGLSGRFVLHDAETLPFPDNAFDVVYSNGVLHHTPNTHDVVGEIRRVLKPGGKAIVMMYAENSLHYWRNLVWAIGLKEGQLQDFSIGEIMSRSVERSEHGARPLVKVYTPERLRLMFGTFAEVEVVQRQMVAAEVPRLLTWVPLERLGSMIGWNLIVKARKPLA
jgi:glycosyltransferase involved in cell wall biosynthesis/ubiquinone/menaquinone biosynthesis C-methylase UbiE